MKWKSLHLVMTAIVLLIYVSSAVLTFGVFFLFYVLDFFPLAVYATVWMPLIPLGVCLVIGTVLAGIVYRHLFRPMEELIRMTEQVAKGDFSVRMDGKKSFGELRRLIEHFNQMSAELGAAEMLKSDFINTFSHEFKTPIVSIRGFAKQLKKKNLSEEERDEYVDIILTESERLASMSTNVLLLSKFENEEFISDRVPYRLDDQLRDCILLLEKQWEKKKIEWIPELSETEIENNAQIVEHLWINLLSNAIKFSPEGGVIEISTEERDDKVTVTLKDHGDGMDQNTLDHIFEKFYQGDTSHASEGNGLGLSIVKRIVELSKGSLEVISEKGRGTTFIVSLPKRL